MREQLAELAARRDQLKHMIHAETCRLSTVRSQSVRVQVRLIARPFGEQLQNVKTP